MGLRRAAAGRARQLARPAGARCWRACGALRSWRRPRAAVWLLVPSVAQYYLSLRGLELITVRYLLPVTVVALILRRGAARACCAAAAARPCARGGHRRWQRVAALLSLARGGRARRGCCHAIRATAPRRWMATTCRTQRAPRSTRSRPSCRASATAWIGDVGADAERTRAGMRGAAARTPSSPARRRTRASRTLWTRGLARDRARLLAAAIRRRSICSTRSRAASCRIASAAVFRQEPRAHPQPHHQPRPGDRVYVRQPVRSRDRGRQQAAADLYALRRRALRAALPPRRRGAAGVAGLASAIGSRTASGVWCTRSCAAPTAAW